MLKPDLQHQFWVTKKAVQRKLGSKEDECIVSSDAELDAKIDLLKSISDSSSQLKRIIDNYQEKISILSQEENSLGNFLRDAGKQSATTSRAMCCAGKSISYSGQQHMKMRAPLVRLQHEVDTFTGRAIKDTAITVHAMERERTEYRAALGWMKAASVQLDPDKGRGLEKFRNAQMYVRTAKTKFDNMSLDCLQKIDLLAAARCNMFSHVLVAYQAALLDYATKTSYTFQAAEKILDEKVAYNFTILKDLTQVPVVRDADIEQNEKKELAALDSDQMLFFKEEFVDDVPGSGQNKVDNKKGEKQNKTDKLNDEESPETKHSDLLDILSNEPTSSQTNEQRVEDLLFDVFGDIDSTKSDSTPQSAANVSWLTNAAPSTNLALDIFKKIHGSTSNSSDKSKSNDKQNKNDKKSSAWMDLFADLDPLANPTQMENRISGTNQNSSAA